MVHNLSGEDLSRILDHSRSEDFGRIKQAVEDLRSGVDVLDRRIDQLDRRLDQQDVSIAVMKVKIMWWSSLAATLLSSAITYAVSQVLKNGGNNP